MKRRWPHVAVCCLAAVLAGAASGAGESSRLVIRLISNNSIASANDKPPKGLSAGDSFTTTSTLRNQVAQFGKPKGALVGRDRAVQTFLSPTAFTIKGYAVLPGGRVLFRGRVTTTGSSVKVTGGTGRYASARGTVTADSLGGTRTTNVYRLTLP